MSFIDEIIDSMVSEMSSEEEAYFRRKLQLSTLSDKERDEFTNAMREGSPFFREVATFAENMSLYWNRICANRGCEEALLTKKGALAMGSEDPAIYLLLLKVIYDFSEYAQSRFSYPTLNLLINKIFAYQMVDESILQDLNETFDTINKFEEVYSKLLARTKDAYIIDDLKLLTKLISMYNTALQYKD